jgi:hydrogenase-4 component B
MCSNVRSFSALGSVARSWNIAVDGLSAVFLMITAFLAVHASLFSIAYMRRYPGGIRGLLPFALFLLGFGIQMGMWPFGEMWIPHEAPVTPSPASAMLSGVMVKIGIYGLLRHFIWLVPVAASADYPLRHWGLAIASLGTITLFIGTMQALQQEHMKRLLAFHSIGQVGYVLFGIGTAMALLATSNPMAADLATLALLAAIFHALNHSLFKSLLYLNAGSVLQASSTEDLNQLGGLMKYMPLTAITALIASLAISGVRLLNGFVSKWMLFVAGIEGAHFAPYLALFAGGWDSDQRRHTGLVHKIFWDGILVKDPNRLYVVRYAAILIGVL